MSRAVNINIKFACVAKLAKHHFLKRYINGVSLKVEVILLHKNMCPSDSPSVANDKIQLARRERTSKG